MKIVFLDRASIGEDIDLSGFEKFGEIVNYNFSKPHEVADRVYDADIIVVNKAPINEETVGKAVNLKLVCVTATGTNNLDKPFLESRGIAWRNVAGYSTESVAQHTFALVLSLLEHIVYYDNYVKSDRYTNDKLFTHFSKHFNELSGKTWGIVGLGDIGKRVASLATAFGCRVIYYSTSGKNHNPDYEEVDFDTVLSQSDILSVHAPLTDDTLHLFDKNAFSKMKRSAIFVNVGRGPIVVEKDLKEALDNGLISAAGIDVLDVEPMTEDNPLRGYTDSNKLIITPHIAWAAVEARQRLMDIIEGQIEDFLND